MAAECMKLNMSVDVTKPRQTALHNSAFSTFTDERTIIFFRVSGF